jgi:plastocyanin
MRKLLIPVMAFAVLALSVALVAGCSSNSSTTTPTVPTTPKSSPSTSPSSGGTTITIADFSFSPATVTVAVGAKVTWKNTGATDHTVTGSGWDSGNIAPGSEYSKTFDTAGTFDYHCSIHPTMTGKVIVTASGTSGGTGGGTPSPSGPASGY